MITLEPPHRLALTFQIAPGWVYEPDPAKASEIEVRFTAEPDGRTRVDFTHRHLERYGGGTERMRSATGVSPKGIDLGARRTGRGPRLLTIWAQR